MKTTSEYPQEPVALPLTQPDKKNRGEWHVRNATRSDIPAIVRIHLAANPSTFLTQLGPAFLNVYYVLLLQHARGVLLVGNCSGTIGGFVSGITQPATFYKKMAGNAWRFAIPLLLALCRSPRLAGRVNYNLRRVLGVTRQKKHHNDCELTSVAVAPEFSGAGLGTELVRTFLQKAWTTGASAVFLTTNAEDNDQANGFYRKLGFSLQRTFRQYHGRLMNEYVLFPPPGRDSQQGSDA